MIAPSNARTAIMPSFPFEPSTTAFAFRGYNVTNQGRSAELLSHALFGPIVKETLDEASEISSASLGRPVDLSWRVREKLASTLDTFAEDIGLILGMELAQIRILQRQFGLVYSDAQVALGYSLGEIAALVAGGVVTLADALPPLMAMAEDSASLAHDVTMGVLFSRGAPIDQEAVERYCVRLNQAGRGVIAISSILAPNALLLLGQGDTVARFKHGLCDALGESVHLRVNQSRWPPLHTPILWQRGIPNRAGHLMHAMGGGLTAPAPPILSLVTGKPSYNDHNCRKLLAKWIDHPQRLWDALEYLLSHGVETIVHVGPEANLIPSTLKRISENVQQQTQGGSLSSLGLRAVSQIARRPWLAKLLSSRTALLRAPFLRHVMLEDWLLDETGGA